MGRWLIAIAGVWAFGLVASPESRASAKTQMTVSKDTQEGLENRRKRTARIKIAGGSARGFCSKSDIARKIRRRAGAIRACYEKALKRNRKLAGKVTARWTIGMSGKVQGPVSARGLGSVGLCIAKQIKRIRFKKPEGGVCVVSWPFVFSSR